MKVLVIAETRLIMDEYMNHITKGNWSRDARPITAPRGIIGRKYNWNSTETTYYLISQYAPFTPLRPHVFGEVIILGSVWPGLMNKLRELNLNGWPTGPLRVEVSCAHEWENYYGLTLCYEYCRKCGIKKENA